MSSGDTPTNVTEKGRVPGILYYEGGRGREEQGGREVEGEGGGGGKRKRGGRRRGREEEGNVYSLLTFFQRLLHVGGKEWPVVWCGHHIVALVLVRGGRLDIGSDTRHNGSVGWDVMLHV